MHVNSYTDTVRQPAQYQTAESPAGDTVKDASRTVMATLNGAEQRGR
jgi:hypothetical protein